MPKYRELHTRILESDDFNEMPDDFTRLVWALLPLILDSEGRGYANIAWLKNKLFPKRENIDITTVREAYDWYVSRGMVIQYEVEGRLYFYVPTFLKYQRGTQYEAKSIIPGPPQETSPQPESLIKPTSKLPEALIKPTTNLPPPVESESAYESESESVSAYDSLTRPNIFSLYENNIGMINPMMSEKLKLAENEFPPGWIKRAIEIAVENNKRHWNYIQAILERWKIDGYDGDRKKGSGYPAKSAKSVVDKITAEVINARKK